jgi:hypothetical protein
VSYSPVTVEIENILAIVNYEKWTKYENASACWQISAPTGLIWAEW